jgi:hypothetical protein
MKVKYKNSNEEIFKLATNMVADQNLLADKEQEFHDFIREILVIFDIFFLFECIFLYLYVCEGLYIYLQLFVLNCLIRD